MKTFKNFCLFFGFMSLSIVGCSPSYAGGFTIESDTAGSVDTQALNFCEEKGSTMLKVEYQGDKISVTCYDKPQTTYTFVR